MAVLTATVTLALASLATLANGLAVREAPERAHESLSAPERSQSRAPVLKAVVQENCKYWLDLLAELKVAD